MQVIDVPGAPYGVTTGPDGALWFTLVAQGAIGRYGDGVVRTFAVDPAGQPTVLGHHEYGSRASLLVPNHRT